MMPELGKYAGTVLSAYGASLALIVMLVALSFWRARRVARDLAKAQGRQDG
jgi:heme exporter protein D